MVCLFTFASHLSNFDKDCKVKSELPKKSGEKTAYIEVKL